MSAVARLADVTHRYGNTTAVDDISLDIPAGKMIGFIGPDGVGKSSVLALISGVRKIQAGTVETLGGDMHMSRHRTNSTVARREAAGSQNLDRAPAHAASWRTASHSGRGSDEAIW